MLYYLGKGTEFKKEDCKEYKTIEGAMKAAAKDESFVVWDENGNLIGSLTDNVPEGALQTNPDGSVNTYDADGNKVGTVDAETVEKMTTFESDEDAAGQQEDAEDGRKWGKYRATGHRGRAGGQSHHPAGKNESDGHLRRLT